MSDAICPRCGQKGRKVHSVTPRSLLVDGARARLGDDDEVRFCRNGDCSVVYFGDGIEPFSTDDVGVLVFQKSSDPGRLVCYCFDHTVEAIETEVQQTGTSAVPDSITAKCKEGLDRCEETNPQGSCCLGNVRQVVKQASACAGAEVTVDSEDSHACCSSKAAEPTKRPG